MTQRGKKVEMGPGPIHTEIVPATFAVARTYTRSAALGPQQALFRMDWARGGPQTHLQGVQSPVQPPHLPHSRDGECTHPAQCSRAQTHAGGPQGTASMVTPTTGHSLPCTFTHPHRETKGIVTHVRDDTGYNDRDQARHDYTTPSRSIVGCTG